MIRGILKNGVILPMDPVPQQWTDGQELVVQESVFEVPGPSAAPKSLKDEFQLLSEEWKKETQYVSSITDIAMHPAYQRIVGLGNQAIPLILQSLAREPSHWFWALRAITGADPVPPQARGKVREMAQAWLRWGRENGWINGNES